MKNWFITDEKLPDNDRYVLAWDGIKKKLHYGYYSIRNGWNILNKEFDCAYFFITHWCELPIGP